MSKKANVIISGGGTGGHIYPGLAIAEALKGIQPDTQVHFVGARGGLEEKIVPRHNYPLFCLRVGRLHPSVGRWKRLLGFALLPISFFQAVWVVVKLKPRWVLGIGGFASGPVVFVASLLGYRTALLEPNAFPGLTNRYLGSLVDYCFVVFEQAGRFFPSQKVRQVGLPVRIRKQTQSWQSWSGRPFRLLVFGGSQGSRAINQLVADWVENLGERAHEFQIVHQIGQRDFLAWSQRYGTRWSSFLNYLEYIHDMPDRLQWADLVICRSGIGSVVEVAMASRPALFIPLPTAADNHQFHNAQVLVSQGAAFLLEEKGLTWQALDEKISQLKSQPDILQKASERLQSIDYSEAAQQILNPLLEGRA